MEKIVLLLSDARGRFIPRDFIDMVESLPKWKGITAENKEIIDMVESLPKWKGITAENKEILKNPEHEWYWEAWQEVLDNAFIVINRRKYTLHQDGDLWAVAYDAMTKKEKMEFFGND